MSRKRFSGFPFIDVESAINKLQILYDREGRNSVNVKIAVEHWGYAWSSSGGKQTVSALRVFGLIEDLGKGDSRQIRLSELGLRILLDTREDSTERDNDIKTAALRPKIFQELWMKWKDTDLPSDANIRHFFIFEKGINEKSANNFVKVFRNTVDFANLSASDSISEENEGDEASTDSPEHDISTTDIQPDVYLEIPTEEKTEIRQDLFSLNEGQVLIRLPKVLSVDSYEDLKTWIDLILRSVERSTVDNNRTQEKLKANADEAKSD